MEGDPHRLLEGALLAAYAAGASRIYLYIHGEAHLSAQRMARAVEDARRWGLVGRSHPRQRLLGRGGDQARRGRLRAGRGDGAHGVARRPARHAAPQAPLPDRGGSLGPADRHQQRGDALRRAADRRPAAPSGGLPSAEATAPSASASRVTWRGPGLVEVEMGATLRDLLERDGRRRGRTGRALKARSCRRALGHHRAAARFRRASPARRPREPGNRRHRRARRDASRSATWCGRCSTSTRASPAASARPVARARRGSATCSTAGPRSSTPPSPSSPRSCAWPRSAASARPRRCPSCRPCASSRRSRRTGRPHAS